ncbi:FAD-dependent oxidoreductase [Rhodococcus opacus]|uniref:FAD-dependent oxidoreductase n=1 Tax=Rhodococcus opacus TaxID=37919 RepID=UPI001F5A74A1|nr:FAD-dependent oxidoreductase [Rhodococcus opacus]UNN04794.1 FAD-dependent oxidoreductase [Rhodococcus opacus]
MTLTEHVDVVVVGGGAGGIAAAVGAARSGARVRLIEQYPFLGGAATNSSVLAFCGFFDQTHETVVAGVGGEVLDRLRARGVYAEKVMGWTGNRIVLLDAEATKIVCDEIVADAGVETRLHTTLVGATRHDGAITGIEVAHKGGTDRITADTFIDASGDGALLALSGSAARTVDLPDRQTNTLACRFGGVAEDADLSTDGMRAAVAAYVAETGTDMPRDHGIAVRLPVTGDVMALLVDEHFDTLDSAQISAAEASARAQTWHYLDAMRKGMAGWQQAYLVTTGPQIGIRESRRLVGKTMITTDDVLHARKRPTESIGRCGWPIEDHAGPGVTRYEEIEGGRWYDVPYDAIRCSDTDNVWGVGRLTSSDDQAFASVRVMGTAFATGHAAGIAAAQSSSGRPHDLPAIRRTLLEQGAIV